MIDKRLDLEEISRRKLDRLEPRVPHISRTEKDKEAAGASVDKVTIVQVDESAPDEEEGDRPSGSVIVDKSLDLEKKVREGGGGGRVIWISHC